MATETKKRNTVPRRLVSVTDTVAPARMTPADAARYLSLAPQTLANWRCEGRGPKYHRLAGKHTRVYYMVADLDSWMEEHLSVG